MYSDLFNSERFCLGPRMVGAVRDILSEQRLLISPSLGYSSWIPLLYSPFLQIVSTFSFQNTHSPPHRWRGSCVLAWFWCFETASSKPEGEDFFICFLRTTGRSLKSQDIRRTLLPPFRCLHTIHRNSTICEVQTRVQQQPP